MLHIYIYIYIYIYNVRVGPSSPTLYVLHFPALISIHLFFLQHDVMQYPSLISISVLVLGSMSDQSLLGRDND